MNPLHVFILTKLALSRRRRMHMLFKVYVVIFDLCLLIISTIAVVNKIDGKTNNKVCEFLENPITFILEPTSITDRVAKFITPPVHKNIITLNRKSLSTKFFVYRNYMNMHFSKRDKIINSFIIFITYIVFHFFVLKIIFNDSKTAKILLALFLPVSIFMAFFTTIHIYIIVALLSIGLSCFSPEKFL
jgi:hypothetical protein